MCNRYPVLIGLYIAHLLPYMLGSTQVAQFHLRTLQNIGTAIQRIGNGYYQYYNRRFDQEYTEYLNGDTKHSNGGWHISHNRKSEFYHRASL